MLKNVGKSKILVSLIAIILMVVLFGNVYSLATEENTSNPVTITATTDTTGATNTNTNTSTNTNTNTNSQNITTNTANVANVSASANNTTNNTTNNTANNTSTYNNTNSVSNSSNLPYTGTNSKGIVLMIVFALSAVYAYKKVSDYNM